MLRLEKEREDALEAVKRLEGEAAKSKEVGGRLDGEAVTSKEVGGCAGEEGEAAKAKRWDSRIGNIQLVGGRDCKGGRGEVSQEAGGGGS